MSTQGKSDLQALMPIDLMQLAVETYVQYLIRDRAKNPQGLPLIAAYCAHLTGKLIFKPRQLTLS